MIYIAMGLGWLALAYLGLTVVLRVVLGAADRLTDGSAWAQLALGLSDLVTLPVVRRSVDGALAGVVFLAVWLRTSAAMEMGASSGTVAAVSGAPQAALTQGVAAMEPCPPAPEAEAEPPPPNCVVSYTVVEGDNLWDISRRFYGDGTQYVVIFRLNEGRVMTTGEPFTNPRLIRPGWVLDVPLPGHNVWTAGEHVMYRVRPDDSLWRISENLLSDGFRWTEIWELNHGRVMTDGRRFSDPDLIYPGWILELPLEARIEVAPPPAEEPPTPSPPAPPSIPSATAPAPTPSEAERAPEEKPTSVPAQEPERDGSGGVQWPGFDPSQVLAAAAGFAYTGGPWPFGYRGLGDLFVFVFFGLVAVAGTYYLQAGAITGLVLLVALPVGLTVTAILVINNLRDIETDRGAGKMTLAVRLGDRATRWQYAVLVGGAYVLLPSLLLTGTSTWTALAAVTFPLALGLCRSVLSGAQGRALNPILKRTAQLHLAFGSLLALGLLL